MRKGLVALVVIVALAALAILLWPREIEQGTAPPEGNASVVIPAEPDHAAVKPPAGDERQAPQMAAAPAPTEPAATPRVPRAVEAADPPVPPAAADGDDEQRDAVSEGAAEELAALTPPGEPSEARPAPAVAPDATEPQDAVAPILDLVRVAPDGQAVIAGRAQPRQQVEILLDGAVVGSAEAGADGAFVAVLETEPAAEPREMRLRVPATAPKGAGAPAAGIDQPAAPDRAAHALSDPVVILPSADPEEAPVLVARGAEAVEVVQPSGPQAADRVALDRLTYESGGDPVAAGRGPEASAVRAYANGALVAETAVGHDGSWQAVIPHEVATAASLLRFDEIARDGGVVSRLEAPFDYSDQGAEQELRQREVVIQRGNNLWRIAEQHYGEGLRYSVIFQANAELIRNPDLIYPGQVFTVPELVDAE